jgi:hypothetical protein
MWSVGDRVNATDIVECSGVHLSRAIHARKVSCRCRGHAVLRRTTKAQNPALQ